MKKRKTSVNLTEIRDEPPRQNPVAKFAGRFNKAKIFGDRCKYTRKVKHAKQEASPSFNDLNGLRSLLITSTIELSLLATK